MRTFYVVFHFASHDGNYGYGSGVLKAETVTVGVLFNWHRSIMEHDSSLKDITILNWIELEG